MVVQPCLRIENFKPVSITFPIKLDTQTDKFSSNHIIVGSGIPQSSTENIYILKKKKKKEKQSQISIFCVFHKNKNTFLVVGKNTENVSIVTSYQLMFNENPKQNKTKNP